MLNSYRAAVYQKFMFPRCRGFLFCNKRYYLAAPCLLTATLFLSGPLFF